MSGGPGAGGIEGWRRSPSRRALSYHPTPGSLFSTHLPLCLYIQSRHATMNGTNYVAFSFAESLRSASRLLLFPSLSSRARSAISSRGYCSRCSKRDGTGVKLQEPKKIGKLESTDERKKLRVTSIAKGKYTFRISENAMHSFSLQILFDRYSAHHKEVSDTIMRAALRAQNYKQNWENNVPLTLFYLLDFTYNM